MATTNINLNNVATQTEVNSIDVRVTTLENNQFSNAIVVQTFADEGGGLTFLPVTGTEGVSYKVANDPNTSLNGYYHWEDSLMDYVKDADLANGVIEIGNIDAVSGDTVYNYAKDKSFIEKGEPAYSVDFVKNGIIHLEFFDFKDDTVFRNYALGNNYEFSPGVFRAYLGFLKDQDSTLTTIEPVGWGNTFIDIVSVKTGIEEYFLKYSGTLDSEIIGRVIVNWDDVTDGVRYIEPLTTSASKLYDSVKSPNASKYTYLSSYYTNKLRYSLFEPDAQVITDASNTFDWVQQSIVLLEIFEYDDNEEFYLQCLGNYYEIGGEFRVFLGIESSLGVVYSTELTSNGTPTNYPYWVVASPLTGIKEYFLYIQGNTDKKYGRIIIDWDKAPTDQQRYATTGQLSELNKLAVQRYIPDISPTGDFVGKKMVALGDSITYGFIPRNAPGYPGQLDSFAKLTAQSLGMNFVNYGISGSSLATLTLGGTAGSPMVYRFDLMDDDADVILIMGGTNDIRLGIPLGTFSDTDELTYYGALKILYQGIYDKYIIDQGTTLGKEKIIIAIAPIKLLGTSSGVIGGTGTLYPGFEAYINAVKEVAAYFSFPVMDFFDLSGINPHLSQTVQGTEPGFTDTYNPYIVDGTHPTVEGHELMSDRLKGFIETLV